MISTKDLPEIAVAQLVVRNLEDEVKARLKRQAERHGRSMVDEIRHILRAATADASRPVSRLGSRIASRFRTIGLRGKLAELRGQPVRPAKLRR